VEHHGTISSSNAVFQKFIYIHLLLCNKVLKLRFHHDLDQLQCDREYATVNIMIFLFVKSIHVANQRSEENILVIAANRL